MYSNMAAPMEAGAIAPIIYKLLTKSNQRTCQYMFQARQMSFINKLKFFQRNKETEEEKDVVRFDEKLLSEEPAKQIPKRLCIEERRAYKPKSEVPAIIHAATNDVFGLPDSSREEEDRSIECQREDWLQISLENRAQKFNLLTQVMEELDHDVSSVDLNDMHTVADVVTYFQQEVKDTSLLEDLTKINLPKNLHMNMDYIRFHPDTDKIHDGITAFPGRPTKVTSVKYKRKYKGYDGGDPINYPEQFTGQA